MVEPSSKKWVTFAAFVLPCFILYLIFFITPFLNGVGISFTNWDGLTNKAPMSMEASEFESQVLNAVKCNKKGEPILSKSGQPKYKLSEKNKEYLLSVYKKEGGEYKRIGIQGIKKYKVESLIKKSGYENKNYKSVGLGNYKTIFTGKADENFYPSKKDVPKYQKKSAIPFTISRAEFETEIVDKDLNDEEKDFVIKAYNLVEGKNQYTLSNDFNEVEVTRPIKNMKLTPSAFKKFANRIKKLVKDGEEGKIESAKKAFIKTNSINKTNSAIVEDACNELVDITNERLDIEAAGNKTPQQEKSAQLSKLDSREKSAITKLQDIDVQAAVVTNFVNKIRELSLNGDTETVKSYCKLFIKDNGVTDPIDVKTVELVCDQLQSISKLKLLLEKTWVVTNYRMGVIGFTLFFAIFSVLGINLLAFALALALDTGIRGQKILRTIYFLPNVLSMIIVALIWNMLFSQLLPAITGIQKWMMDPNKAPWLLVLVATWQGAGYYMIIYLAGLQNIPTDIIEAAMIDGATWKQRFINITLPMMIPSLTISLFLTIANAFKSFDLMYAMVGPSGYATGTVPIVYDIFFQAYTKKQAGMATAEAMLLFFVIVVISGIQLYVMKKKEVEA